MSLFTENFHYSKIKFCLPYHPYHEKQNVKETFEYYVIKFRNINTRVIEENIYRGWSWIMFQNRTLWKGIEAFYVNFMVEFWKEFLDHAIFECSQRGGNRREEYMRGKIYSTEISRDLKEVRCLIKFKIQIQFLTVVKVRYKIWKFRRKWLC
jgi:hypothetical protein